MIFCCYECVEEAVEDDEVRAVHVLASHVKTSRAPPVPCFENISIDFRLNPLLLEKIPRASGATSSRQNHSSALALKGCIFRGLAL